MRRPALVRLALPALLAPAVLLSGCGSAPTRAPDSQATVPPRPGGYYKDDGPGDNPPANFAAIADAEPRAEPLHRFANNPYNALGQDYVPFRELRPYRERGTASWYGRRYHGQRTSSGETYDMYAMTAAHPVLPIPSYARVTSVANGRSVIVRINDRGPFRSGRIIDLSYTAAWKLGYTSAGSALVEVVSITPDEYPLLAARRAGNSAPPAGAIAAAEVRPVAPVAAPESQPLDGAPFGAPAAAAAAPAVTAATIPVSAEAGGVYLQLGAFSARENAENFRAKINGQLSWLDRAIEILPRDGLFRLHVGPYRDRAEAGAIADRIRDALDLKAVFVTR